MQKNEKILINIFIILLAVSPAFALGEGNKNLLLIGVMCLSPYFIIRYPIIIPKIDFPLISICMLMIALPIMFHPETMRWSTILYSCLFCLLFMSFARIMYNSDYNENDFSKILKYLLYAYCVVLMIQQFCVLTGIPIFNLSNYNPREPWKLNSLTAEPSHSARVVTLLFYMYLTSIMSIYKTTDMKVILSSMDKKVLFAYMYPIITMGSGTGFFLMILLLMNFFPVKKVSQLLLGCLIICPILFFLAKNNSSFKRTIDFATSMVFYDETHLIRTDLSAAIRIVPTIHGAKEVNIHTLNGLIGHGVDADEGLTPLPSVDCGAGSFSIWYNFGVVVAFVFWIFTFRICYKNENKFISITFWILFCFFYGGLNNQIIWLVLALFLTNRYVRQRKNPSINNTVVC